jgi:uncharacterized protein (TIGR02266 family)
MREVEAVVGVEMDEAPAGPANPLADAQQVGTAIQQRRDRLAQLQAERESYAAQLAQIAAQQEALATQTAELQYMLQENDAHCHSTVKALDGLLQTHARLEAVQGQAAAAEQSRAAFQARAAARTGPGKPGTEPLTVVPEQQLAGQSPPPRSIVGNAAQPAAVPPPVPGAGQPVNVAAVPPPLPVRAATPPEATPPMLRAAQRVPFAAEVDFTSDTNLFVGFSENISDGGLFVATPHPLPLGAHVAVSLTLPGQRAPIRCDTQVAWTLDTDSSARGAERVPGMGLKFLNLTDTDHDRLRAFVALREPLFFPS